MAFGLNRSHARGSPETRVTRATVQETGGDDTSSASRCCCIPLPSARGLCNALQSFLAQFTATVTPQTTEDVPVGTGGVTGDIVDTAPLADMSGGVVIDGLVDVGAGVFPVTSSVSLPVTSPATDSPNAVSKEDLAASSVKAQAMGSETPSSDKDYSVTGKSPENGTVSVSTEKRAEVVSTFKELFESTSKKTLDQAMEGCGDVPLDSEGKAGRRKLTPETTSNALGLLKANNNNWFDTLKVIDGFKSADGCTQEQKDTCDQLLFDIRQLQTDMVDNLTLAINSDFSSITETDIVKELNNMVGEISGGKEAGTLFDTNFYTNHKALSKGIDIKSPKTKATWKLNNEVNAAVKRAQQYPEMHIGADGKPDMELAKADYDVYVEKQLGGLEGDAKDAMQAVYDKAWLKMEDREHSIGEAKAEVLASGIDGLSDAESTLKAMNRCYEKALENVELKLKDLNDMEADFKTKPEGPEKDALKLAIESQLESTIQAQSESLLFANEPYYSQATIVDVVVGMQMSKKAPDSFIASQKESNPSISDGEILNNWKTQLKEDYPILNDPDGQRIASQENFADLCKCKNEYKITDNKSAEHHLKKASKYADRALNLMLTAANASSKSNSEFKAMISEIKDQNKVIYDIRQGDAKMPEGKTFAGILLESPTFNDFEKVKFPDIDSSQSMQVAECFHDFMELIEADAKTNV